MQQQQSGGNTWQLDDIAKVGVVCENRRQVDVLQTIGVFENSGIHSAAVDADRSHIHGENICD